MDPNPDLAEADALLSEALRLKRKNQITQMQESFNPSPHLGNRALRRQAAKNQKRKSR